MLKKKNTTTNSPAEDSATGEYESLRAQVEMLSERLADMESILAQHIQSTFQGVRTDAIS